MSISNFFWLITLLILGFSLSVFISKAFQQRRRFFKVSTWIFGLFKKIYPLVSITCITLVVFALTLPLWEYGLRYYFNHYGTEEDRIRYVYPVGKIKSLQSRIVGLPYVGYGLSRDYEEFNSLGYRGEEVIQPKPEGVFRIVALGGSTTFGFGIDDSRDTYPAQLEQILRREYGYRNIEVINAGVELYTSWEILANFQFRVLDLDPDLIIYYEATNEITARLVYPEFYNGLNEARGLWRTDQAELPPSTLWRWIAIQAGWLDDPVGLESSFVFETEITKCNMWSERTCGDYLISDLMNLNPPIYFERNLRNLIAIAQANDVKIMLSSWAYFPDSTSITNIYTFPWRRAAVEEHNTLTQQIGEETHTAFYDLLANMPYDITYWYIDGYHQSELGAEEQARQYAQFIHEQEWINSD